MDVASLIIGILTLFVAAATLIVSICAYKYAQRSNKQRIKEQIECKQAKIKAIDRMPHFGVGFDVVHDYQVQKMELEAEIEQLKKML